MVFVFVISAVDDAGVVIAVVGVGSSEDAPTVTVVPDDVRLFACLRSVMRSV